MFLWTFQVVETRNKVKEVMTMFWYWLDWMIAISGDLEVHPDTLDLWCKMPHTLEDLWEYLPPTYKIKDDGYIVRND